ncbi:MAG: hypothetical protein MI746_13360 [Pseudomonadales bacterium]|nr:hypothetical protein [Pseudomonadales bacterium]
MLGKILLTLAVIAIATIYVRQRNMADASAEKTSNAATTDDTLAKEKSELSSDIRLGAYLFLIMMVGVGAALYYFRWQDDHTILTVNLHRENQAQPVSYQVYKYQLEERSFTTVEGTLVTVAGSERMEILGLEE